MNCQIVYTISVASIDNQIENIDSFLNDELKMDGPINRDNGVITYKHTSDPRNHQKRVEIVLVESVKRFRNARINLAWNDDQGNSRQRDFFWRCIDIETANAFIRDNKSVNLKDYSFIQDDAAQAISNYYLEMFSDIPEEDVIHECHFLNVGGLLEISEKSAGYLSTFIGDLSLDGICHVSDEVAACLSRHRGGILFLSGIRELSHSNLITLAKHEELIYLDGLTELSDEAAQEISKNPSCGGICFNGVARISDKAAIFLSEYQGWHLGLGGLTQISEAGANALKKHQGYLEINCI